MMDDRLTRCPHCSTCFAVSDADLQQAFGVARCGRCKKIFNAANHLFELEADESSFSAEPLQTLSSDDSETLTHKNKPETEPVDPFAETDSDKHQPAALSPTETYEKRSVTTSEPKQQAPVSDLEKTHPSGSQTQASQVSKAPENAEDLLETLPDAPDMMLDDEDLSAIREARKTPELRHHQLEVSLTADREDDAPGFAADLHFSAEPDHNHQEQPTKAKPSAKTATGLPWIPATLAASLILLILVLLWGNTRTLSQSPGLSGFAEAICGMTGCDHYLPSDFEDLKASQLAIFEINNQLTAELVLNNPTATPLPFPAILLELRDRTGKITTEVLYQPDTYLKGKPFADHILPPELPVALSFPIQAKVSDIENLSVRYYPAAN